MRTSRSCSASGLVSGSGQRPCQFPLSYSYGALGRACAHPSCYCFSETFYLGSCGGWGRWVSRVYVTQGSLILHQVNPPSLEDPIITNPRVSFVPIQDTCCQALVKWSSRLTLHPTPRRTQRAVCCIWRSRPPPPPKATKKKF